MKSIANKLWLIFMLGIIYKPGYIFLSMPLLNRVWDVVAVAVCVFIFIRYMKRGNFSILLIAFLLFISIEFIATLYNSSDDLLSLVRTSAAAVALCMLTEMELSRNPVRFIHSFMLILLIYLSINLVTIFLFPEGMIDHTYVGRKYCWFLGYKNGFIYYILPCVCFAMLYAFSKRLRYSVLVMIIFAISAYSFTYAPSSTGIVILALAFLYYIILYDRKLLSIFNSYTYLGGYAVLFVSIVFFRLQDIFAFVIEGFLQKSLTFTSRTILWDITIAAIGQRPFLGYGFFPVDPSQSFYTISNISAHNHILTVAFQSGMIGLVFFLALICLAAHKLYIARESMYASVLSFTLFLFFVIMLMEVVPKDYLFCFLFISYHVDKIIDYDKNKQLSKESSLFHSKYIRNTKKKCAY